MLKLGAKAGLRLPADGCTGRVGGGDEWAPSGIVGPHLLSFWPRDLLHLERKDAIGAAGLVIVVDGSALHERHARLQFREGDNHGVARVEVRRPGGPLAPARAPIS